MFECAGVKKVASVPERFVDGMFGPPKPARPAENISTSRFLSLVTRPGEVNRLVTSRRHGQAKAGLLETHKLQHLAWIFSPRRRQCGSPNRHPGHTINKTTNRTGPWRRTSGGDVRSVDRQGLAGTTVGSHLRSHRQSKPPSESAGKRKSTRHQQGSPLWSTWYSLPAMRT